MIELRVSEIQSTVLEGSKAIPLGRLNFANKPLASIKPAVLPATATATELLVPEKICEDPPCKKKKVPEFTVSPDIFVNPDIFIFTILPILFLYTAVKVVTKRFPARSLVRDVIGAG